MCRVVEIAEEGWTIKPDKKRKSFVTKDLFVVKGVAALSFIGGFIRPIFERGM